MEDLFSKKNVWDAICQKLKDNGTAQFVSESRFGNSFYKICVCRLRGDKYLSDNDFRNIETQYDEDPEQTHQKMKDPELIHEFL